MSITKVAAQPPVVQQQQPVQAPPKQPSQAQQTPTQDGAKKVDVKLPTPPVQPQRKVSPEESRENPSQKRTEKLKPDTFDILV